MLVEGTGSSVTAPPVPFKVRSQMKNLADMNPEEHLERAQALAQRFDSSFLPSGSFDESRLGSRSGYTITPVALTLADLHLKLAREKRAQNRRE